VEGQDGGVDTEEYVPAQHFHVPVVEVEGLMENYGRGVDERLVRRRTCDCGADGRSVIRSICNS
jgi:hypothetical protein